MCQRCCLNRRQALLYSSSPQSYCQSAFIFTRRQIAWQFSVILHALSLDREGRTVALAHKSPWLYRLVNLVEVKFAQMANERDNYIATLDAINDAVIRTDKHGKIVNVNNACLALFDCQASDLITQDYDLCQRAIEVPEDHIHFADILRKIQKGERRLPLYKSTFHVKMNQQVVAIEQQVTAIYQGNDELDGTVVVLRDVTKAEKLRARLRFQANHDNVTKLFNRYKFEQRFVDAWHNAQNNEVQHALLQLDMDRFKLINDNAGHAAGDELLRDVAAILKDSVRDTDICARIGGDEFAVLLYDVDQETVQVIMNKLNSALKALPFSFAGQVFEIGASIGATIINEDSPPIAEVKRQADTACFIAKNKGVNYNQIFIHDDHQLVSLQQEPRWAAKIHNALENDDFSLFYQLIRPLTGQDGKQHIEILLRLKLDGNLLSPNVFLPAVERFRLTDKVDYWVVSKTFAWFEQQQALWQKQIIAINLSGESICNETLIDDILACHQRCHFPASAICFEITETAAIADLTMATAMVDKLKQAGFVIALDDFGKGFSTFSYLKSLPAEYIKIDGSYVENILTNDSDLSIVKAIASMAKTMDMQTIAEFVQCDQSVELLDELGVDFVQGYGIGMPAPLDSYIK